MDEEKEEKGLSELLKKVVTTGVTAAFMTEDAIRTALKDKSIPKDTIQGLIQNAKNTKEEFVTSIRKEMRNYLNKVDLKEQIDRVLKDYDFEINAKVSAKKKESGTKKS